MLLRGREPERPKAKIPGLTANAAEWGEKLFSELRN